jgi:hypothetical protein
MMMNSLHICLLVWTEITTQCLHLLWPRADPLAPSKLYAQLLGFEHHTSLEGNSAHGGSLSTMMVSCGHSYSRGRGSSPSSRGTGRGRGCGRTQHGGFSNLSGHGIGTSNNGLASQPQCQVCDKIGHTAKKC